MPKHKHKNTSNSQGHTHAQEILREAATSTQPPPPELPSSQLSDIPSSSLAEASLLSNIENETPARAAEILNILVLYEGVLQPSTGLEST